MRRLLGKNMWSAKKVKSRAEAGLYQGAWGGGWTEIYFNGKLAFCLEEWMLHSCSIAGFYRFDNYVSPAALNNSTEVKNLIEFLRPKHNTAWF
jgi:hypothetical protein